MACWKLRAHARRALHRGAPGRGEYGLHGRAAGDRTGRAIALPVAGAAFAHDDPAHAHSDLSVHGSTRPCARDLQLRGERCPARAVGDAGVARDRDRRRRGVPQPRRRAGADDAATRRASSATQRPDAAQCVWRLRPFQTASFRRGWPGWSRAASSRSERARQAGLYGEPWRSFKATKANTWKDGVACAQYPDRAVTHRRARSP